MVFSLFSAYAYIGLAVMPTRQMAYAYDSECPESQYE
jgi:hypothetical protein